MQASRFLEEDVPCPEDFPLPSVAPGLRELDEALRCNICKEVYSAPVTIGCGHCFCSLCIRQELPQLAKSECPMCRLATNESHIRKNTKLEEAVKAWNLARPLVLELLKDDERRRKQAEQQKSRTPPPSVTSSYFRNSFGQASPKKRKRSTQSDDDNELVEVTASQLERSNLSDKGKKPARNSSPGPPSVASGSNSPALGECPLCNKFVPLKTINEHIDSTCTKYCLSDVETKQKQKKDWSHLFATGTHGEAGPSKPKSAKEKAKADAPVDDNADPIPKVSYDTIKTKRLKEMLQEYDLPISGEREHWVARHQRWVIIFNANLDSSHRKSLEQLRKDLAAWEKAKQSKKPAVSDPKTHERVHNASFTDLIANAKASAEKAKAAAAKPSQTQDQRGSPIEVDGDVPSSREHTSPPPTPPNGLSSPAEHDLEVMVVDS